jgi:hypothetical protein
MSLPRTCLFRARIRCKNGGDSCSESFRADHPLGKSVLFADHQLYANIVMSSSGLAEDHFLAIVNTWAQGEVPVRETGIAR